MAASWSTHGNSDWSSPSGWQAQNRAGQISPAGQPQAGGMWGTHAMPQQGGGMQAPGGGMFDASQMQPWMQQYQMAMQAGAPQNAAMSAQAPQNQTQAANFNAAQAGGIQPQGISVEDVWKFLNGKNGGGMFSGGNQTITQNPWAPQGKGLEGLYKKAEEEYARQRELGAPKFSQESQEALRRMEAMTGRPNPLVGKAINVTQDITSGDTKINTADKFNQLYNQPGVTNSSQYNKLYNDPTITGEQSYRQMMNENPITGLGQYQNMANTDAITNASMYNKMANNPIGAGQFNQIYQGMNDPGSLSKGMFNQLAQGNLVEGNPYRESNIKQSMGDTAKMVKASMSKAGRYGSDAYGDAMGKALSSVATQAREAGYNQDTANMMAAAQARSGENLGMTGLGLQAAQGRLSTEQINQANRLAAAQGISNIQGQNAQQRLAALQGMSSAQLQNQQSQFAALQGLTGMQNLKGQQQLAAAQGLTNVQAQNAQQRMQAAQGLTGVQGQNIANQMQAAGMAPEMQKLRYDDMNRLLGIGATKEAMTQQQRDFGWQQLQQLQGTYGGLPGTAGTKTEPGKPWWQQMAGLAMTGLGMTGQ